MHWNFVRPIAQDARIFGDEWECCSGEMQWTGVGPTRCMLWVCMISNGSDSCADVSGRYTQCYGVKVCPAAMCVWQVDQEGVTLWMDVHNGAAPCCPADA